MFTAKTGLARRLLVSLCLAAAFPLSSAHLVAQTEAGPTTRGVNVILQPGDAVRLKIWREPDLSGDFVVDEHGEVVLPKIGRAQVERLSADSLKVLLTSKYESYLRNPSVDVTVLRRVNVLGAIRNPGLFYVDPTVTLADVVALAGGVNPNGNQKKVELLRDGAQMSIKFASESRLGDLPLRSGDRLRVPERSWFARNTTVVTAGITAAGVIAAALIRPWR